VANKKGTKRRGVEFWRRAVKRLEAGENAGDLAAELGINRRGLYQWRVRLSGGTPDPGREQHTALRRELDRLKRALAEKVLEVDFLQGALHKIEVRRQGKPNPGAQASTTRSGK
jgi:transposase-like protein